MLCVFVDMQTISSKHLVRCPVDFRDVLLKHHSQRVHEACSLMTDILNTSLIRPTTANQTTMAHQDSRVG